MRSRPRLAQRHLEVGALAIAAREARDHLFAVDSHAKVDADGFGSGAIAIRTAQHQQGIFAIGAEQRQRGTAVRRHRRRGNIDRPRGTKIILGLHEAGGMTGETIGAGFRRRLDRIGLDTGVGLFNSRQHTVDAIAVGVEQREGVEAIGKLEKGRGSDRA